MQIPITVFTGYLGSGKTTIIINLVKQLPADYKLVLLKNEFGSIDVDSQLAKENNIQVKEMLNGCLCCVLVGKLENALKEILAKYTPERIIIETSGSAYPGPIAWEIRRLQDYLKLDGIVTVIDALNFPGYKDKSYTAKLQAKETDLILINKHENIPEVKLDKVLDDVYDINPSTPKVKTDHGRVNSDLIFGIDTKLFNNLAQVNGEVQQIDPNHQHKEVDMIEVVTAKNLSKEQLTTILKKLPSLDFYRIKGIINDTGKAYLLNYVFGKLHWQLLNSIPGPKNKILFLGKNFAYHSKQLKSDLNLEEDELKFYPRSS